MHPKEVLEHPSVDEMMFRLKDQLLEWFPDCKVVTTISPKTKVRGFALQMGDRIDYIIFAHNELGKVLEGDTDFESLMYSKIAGLELRMRDE